MKSKVEASGNAQALKLCQPNRVQGLTRARACTPVTLESFDHGQNSNKHWPMSIQPALNNYQTNHGASRGSSEHQLTLA